jgi:uncharacterized protein
MRRLFLLLLAAAALGAGPCGALEPLRTALSLQADEVLATGNEWLALPELRASDGALMSFNALSMRERGLLQVRGEAGRPALEPYFKVDGAERHLQSPAWALLDYWVPEARQQIDGIDFTLSWCAPPGYRAGFLRLTATNRRSAPATITLGARASFGALQRVTYVPVSLRGERRVGPAPWVDPGEAFSYVTDDTRFAWALVHPGSQALVTQAPLSAEPAADAAQSVVLQPGQAREAVFILAIGVEEFSAAHNARALREMLDREGSEAMLARAASWARARERSTGRPELDLLLNRNTLFTIQYAWGRTIDTEQLVGVTSRSPRYYVSAAYWDRDAMLWSFPALLDVDRPLAREALGYALTTQLRNAGTHSRFIDGVVLEDGFQLDEAAAPVIALASYVRATGDTNFLAAHREALQRLREGLQARFEPQYGLYSSLQDSQDEYQKLPFLTYDNVLVWRALGDLASLYTTLRDTRSASELTRSAAALHAAILAHLVDPAPTGATGPVFAVAGDGSGAAAGMAMADIPPGSLLRLPALGFIAADDPLFQRTWGWLHSAHYPWSNAGRRYGLPGSYRLPFTPVWTVADELHLPQGREAAERVLLASRWDAGIFSEGVDPDTARMDRAGGAFATAAGYLAHAICQRFCIDPIASKEARHP